MGFISHFLAGGLFNRSEMNKKLDEISDALTPSWKLIDTIDNTVGYSGTWTAPDVFGDGSAYDLGVYMIGGGASGEGIAQSYSKQYATEANGGPSGFGKNVVIGNVKPGDNFPWVVGAKGARASATASNGGIKVASNNGGTTSFNGETAPGGTHSPRAGGQSPDTVGTTELPTGSRNLFGSCPPITAGNSYTQSPRESQNIFDPEMVTLSAGGRGYITTGGVAYSQTIGALPDGTKAGNGKAAFSNSVSGVDATGYGNGGGGCAAMATTNGATVTVTCGAGSDGVIFLYARKAVRE